MAPGETTPRPARLGPIAAGLLLDLVDFATYGPIGLWVGFAAGGAAGYLLAASLGVRADRRLGYALVAGVYCMLPFTAFLPLATALGALVRLRERNPPAPELERDPSARRVIDVPHTAVWDDPAEPPDE